MGMEDDIPIEEPSLSILDPGKPAPAATPLLSLNAMSGIVNFHSHCAGVIGTHNKQMLHTLLDGDCQLSLTLCGL